MITFLKLESCVDFILECYERNESEDVKEGLFELTKSILQYGLLILDTDSTDIELVAVLNSIRHLAAMMVEGFNVPNLPSNNQANI